MDQQKLLKYSFCWNQVRLVIAAISLLWAATPVFFRISYAFSGMLYTLVTIVSGIVGVYLLYLWNQNERKLFGANDPVDLIAFMIATLSGVHLGLGGLLGTNFIMTTLSPFGFLLTLAIYAGGILYLWSAYHLHKRYKENNEKLF